MRDSWLQPAIVETDPNEASKAKPQSLVTKSTFEDLGSLADSDY